MIYYACQSKAGSLSSQVSPRGLCGAWQEKHIMKADCGAWGWDWNRHQNRHQHRFRRAPWPVIRWQIGLRPGTRATHLTLPSSLPSRCGRRQQREQQQAQVQGTGIVIINSVSDINIHRGGEGRQRGTLEGRRRSKAVVWHLWHLHWFVFLVVCPSAQAWAPLTECLSCRTNAFFMPPQMRLWLCSSRGKGEEERWKGRGGAGAEVEVEPGARAEIGEGARAEVEEK